MLSHFQKNGQRVGKKLADFSGPFTNKDEKASCKISKLPPKQQQQSGMQIPKAFPVPPTAKEVLCEDKETSARKYRSIILNLNKLVTNLDLYCTYSVPSSTGWRNQKEREDFREWKVQQLVFTGLVFNFKFSRKKGLDYLENWSMRFTRVGSWCIRNGDTRNTLICTDKTLSKMIYLKQKTLSSCAMQPQRRRQHRKPRGSFHTRRNHLRATAKSHFRAKNKRGMMQTWAP